MMDLLDLWIDGSNHDGAANMAIDEWLLRSVERPALRIYSWEPNWGSYGYFVPDAEAAAALPDRHRVRRWTGGGIVDHRQDWTYTLVVPRQDPLAQRKGGESYRVIHEALARAMIDEGLDGQLSSVRTIARGGECFEQAVEHDLIDANGRKLAGAGQRRTAEGLLHQGSLALRPGEDFAIKLAKCLAKGVCETAFKPDGASIEALIARRYGCEAWRTRR